MTAAIVTGAGGFVGQAVVRELLSQNMDVLAVVHSKKRNISALEGAQIVECDMENYDKLPLYAKNNANVFYHFAWNGTSGALRTDEKIQLTNVRGACDAVHAAAAMGCRRFVFASSIMQYEVDAAIKSMKNPSPGAIYSTGKLAADYLSRILAESHGLEYISALISNIFGPGESSPRLINSSIRKLLKGEHLSLSPCLQMYDFVYIDDAARMFTGIGDKGIPGSIYYIGNRTPQPLRTFMEQMRNVVAPEADLGFGDLPFNGVSLTYKEFDTELFYRDIGYVPIVSFSEGVRRTCDWIKSKGV